jgi:hypothetical protein
MGLTTPAHGAAIWCSGRRDVLLGDPRLGVPDHRVAGSDGVVQPRVGHDAHLSRRTHDARSGPLALRIAGPFARADRYICTAEEAPSASGCLARKVSLSSLSPGWQDRLP